MEEISQEAYSKYPCAKPPGAVFTEKQWFQHEHLLGVVVFDHDGEWAWVVLAKHDDGRYRAIDYGASLSTKSVAVGELGKALARLEHIREVSAGPPATREQSAQITAAETGMSVEEVLRGMDDFERAPKPGNN